MPKRPSERMTETLGELSLANPDLGHFVRFCLYDAGTVHALWGNGYLHTRNNATGQETAIAKKLSLGLYRGHTAATPRRRRRTAGSGAR